MKYPKCPMLFDCFDPDCGAALIIAVAEAMSAGLNDDQMNVLGTFLSAVADTISYMAAQISYNKEICAPKEESEGDDESKKEENENLKRAAEGPGDNGDSEDEEGGSPKPDKGGSDNKDDSKSDSDIKRTVNKNRRYRQ